MSAVQKVKRENPIPESKKKAVKELVEKFKTYRTVLVASSRGLPGQQFHEIKKKLRGRAEIKVSKKSIIFRVIDSIDKGAVKNLKNQIDADIVLLFSEMDPFELSGLLTDNFSSRKAKAGDTAPMDIEIETGPTDLPPGPAISELSGVGLKVAVKEGKLEITKGAVVAKKGEPIKDNVASVLGKLNVSPIKVGFIPLAAYDGKDDAIYVGIVIDKEGALEELKEAIKKSLSFSVNVHYPVKENISYFIAKASMEEKALSSLLEKPVEEVKKKEASEDKQESEEKKDGESEKEEASEDKQENVESKEENTEESKTDEVKDDTQKTTKEDA